MLALAQELRLFAQLAITALLVLRLLRRVLLDIIVQLGLHLTLNTLVL